MQHKPRGFLRDLQVAGYFVTANSVLAVGEHPHCRKPLVQRNRAIFKNRPHLDRKLAFRVMTSTLPSAALGVEVADAIRATYRVNHTIRPAPNGEIVNAVV